MTEREVVDGQVRGMLRVMGCATSTQLAAGMPWPKRCVRCKHDFTVLSGSSIGCPVHGIVAGEAVSLRERERAVRAALKRIGAQPRLTGGWPAAKGCATASELPSNELRAVNGSAAKLEWCRRNGFLKSLGFPRCAKETVWRLDGWKTVRT